MNLNHNGSYFRFSFTYQSSKYVQVNIEVILISSSMFVNNVTLINESNQNFNENETKHFNSKMYCNLINTIQNRFAYFKDNNLRVKVKISKIS